VQTLAVRSHIGNTNNSSPCRLFGNNTYESGTVLPLLRAALDLDNRIALCTRQRQRVRPGARPSEPALMVAPGWIHVDASPNVLLAGRRRILQAVANRFILTEAGFVDVVECQFRVGRKPDLVDLDNRSHETLYVEAARPLDIHSPRSART